MLKIFPLALLAVLILGCTQLNLEGRGEDQRIQTGDLVVLNYTGTVNGFVFETSDPQLAKQAGIPNPNIKPLTFQVGSKQVYPGIEEAVVGMRVGQNKTFTLPPEKTVGLPRKDRIQNMTREELGVAEVKPGLLLEKDGLPIGIIREVYPDNVTVDFNHPLAGKNLTFTIWVVSAKRLKVVNASAGGGRSGEGNPIYPA